MYSIRAFSRSLPRVASRSANYSTRSAFRPSIPSSLRCSPAFQQPLTQRLAAFSTTRPALDDAAQELSAKLSSEISLEGENTERATESDGNVEVFRSQGIWDIEDNPGDQDVVLKRTYDDEHITVTFSIADFNTPSVYGDGEEADEAFMDEEDPGEMSAQSGGGNTKGAINQGKTGGGNFKVAPEDRIAPADREELANEEDEYESQQAFPANVDVLITRPGGKGALRVSLVVDAGRFTIHKVMHTASADKTVPDNLYTGPPFDQLDEEVQSLLEQYLDVRGINTALANFVPDFIDVKEQKEYVGWLERVQKFVD